MTLGARPLRRARQPGGAQPQPVHPCRLRAPDRAGTSNTAACCARWTASTATVREFARRATMAAARGCNVTVPFKFEALRLAARCSERAALAGAANTLRFDADGLVRRQHRRRRPGARHRAQRRRAAGRPARAAGGRRRRRRRRAGAAAGRTAGRVGGRQPHARQGPGAGGPPCRAGPGRTACALAASGLDRPGAAFDVVLNASASSLHGAGRRRCRAAALRPGALAVDLMYGAAAEPFLAWAREAGATRPRRPGHAGRAGGRVVLPLARRAPAHGAGAAGAARRPGGGAMKARPGMRRQLRLRLLALLLLCAVALQLVFALRIGLMSVVDPQSTTFQRSEAWRLLVERQRILWSQDWVDARPHLRPPQARRHRQRGRRLRRPLRRRVGRHREGLGAQPARRGARRAGRPAPARARAAAEGRRRLDDHPATGQEPAAVGRAHGAAQGPGAAADADAGSPAGQAAHPGDLPQQRRMGRRRVRRPGGGAALFPRRRGAARRRRRRRGWRSCCRRPSASRSGPARPTSRAAPRPSWRAWARWSCHECRQAHECEIAAEIAAAARLVVEEGMEYAAAKRKAGRDHGRRAELPSNEQVEDEVREHIELFCADTQPAELRALREVALLWMQRLAAFPPAPGRRGVARHGHAAFGGAHRPVLRRPQGRRDRPHQRRRRLRQRRHRPPRRASR